MSKVTANNVRTVRVNSTDSEGNPVKGTRFRVRPGDVYDSEDQVVKDNPDLFDAPAKKKAKDAE